jgi:ketosteroid isomerase-like protein
VAIDFPPGLVVGSGIRLVATVHDFRLEDDVTDSNGSRFVSRKFARRRQPSMINRALWLETWLAGVALVALTGTDARAQYPPLSADETANVEREVRAAVRAYYQLFSSRDTKAVAERIFHVPWILLDPDGATVFSSAEETQKLFEGSLAQVLPRGWERSDFPSPSVCVLSLGSATASGTFYRYRKDGSVLSEHGVTYVFGKTPDGWRILSLASHPPGRGVECRD